MKLSVHASHTAYEDQMHGMFRGNSLYKIDTPVRMGDLHRLSTLWKNVWPGIPPSRANAYIMRELDVIENVLWMTSLVQKDSEGHLNRLNSPTEKHSANNDNLRRVYELYVTSA
jgi:hypothetical protein